MRIKIDIELEPFRVPNYVRLKPKPGLREEGFVDRPKYHLSELSDEILESLCEQFRKDVFAKKATGEPR